MPYLTLITLCSFLLSIIAGPYIISILKKLQKEGQPIRSDGPPQHLQTKKGTPTMGGLIILLPTILLSLIAPFIYPEIDCRQLLILIFTLGGYALLGGADDYKKLLEKSSKGLSVKVKLFGQLTIAMVIVLLLDTPSTLLTFPGNFQLNLGWLYYPFVMKVILAYSNAVNVTDGLDGLVTVPIILAAACLSIMAYHSEQYAILFFCMSLIGSSLGFLLFNANPAKVFMGDMGSLSIGAALGTMSIMMKQEVIFAIIAGLFVLEAISVVMQVYYFKMTGGKRIFLMAPIHHHFEQLGWSENTIVVRFWIFAALCAIFGMSFL